jgi:hypothetical protein
VRGQRFEEWLFIQLRQERDVYSLITKARAKLRRSDMLKLQSHIRLELKGIPQQRETRAEMTIKSSRADKLRIRRGDIRNREARKPKIL